MLFPIQQLIEGRGAPLCVRKDTTVNDALALMVKNDYSQLPVVDEDGDLCGIISETSIIGMYHHVGATVSLLDLTVDHCATTPVTISPESDIFVALDLLKNVYAIVVVKNKKPVGILTDYDTTHFFRDVTEDLILVEDIEVTLRQQYIEIAFPEEKALEAALIKAFGHDKKDTTKPAQEYEELSFRQHAQLITTGKNWPKFKGTLEPKDLFKQLMEQVGEIRNQLAHFRGRLDPVQHNVLLRARDWLAARPKLALPVADEQQVVRIYADDVPTEKPAEKYAPLENWLAQHRDRQRVIRVSFEDIDALLGEPLPDSARKHRSWWTNDHTTDVQPLAWLRAGWRVDDVDLTIGEVTFRQTNSVLMQLFFADLLERLKGTRPGITRARKTLPQNWWSFGAGRAGFYFGWVFAQKDKLRVELYIDTGSKERNKAGFDALKEQKKEIEQAIGSTLNWERLNHRRASRISVARPTLITDPPDELEKAKQWALETTLKFVDAFQPRLKELPSIER